MCCLVLVGITEKTKKSVPQIKDRTYTYQVLVVEGEYIAELIWVLLRIVLVEGEAREHLLSPRWPEDIPQG